MVNLKNLGYIWNVLLWVVLNEAVVVSEVNFVRLR